MKLRGGDGDDAEGASTARTSKGTPYPRITDSRNVTIGRLSGVVRTRTRSRTTPANGIGVVGGDDVGGGASVVVVVAASTEMLAPITVRTMAARTQSRTKANIRPLDMFESGFRVSVSLGGRGFDSFLASTRSCARAASEEKKTDALN